MFTSVSVTNTLSHFVSLLEPPSYKAVQTKTSGLSTQWFIIQDSVALSMAFATYSLPLCQSPVLFLTLLNSISRSPPTFSRRLTFLDAPACSGSCTPSLFPGFFFKTLSCCPLYRDCLLWGSGRETGREKDGKMTQPRQFGLLSCRKYHNLSLAYELNQLLSCPQSVT